MPDVPQHDGLVHFIKCIFSIYYKEFPFLFHESHMACMAWMIASMLLCKQAHKLSILHAAATSLSVTRRIELAMAHCKVSPMPIGLTPGILSMAINLPDHRARYAAKGGKEFPIHMLKLASECRSVSLA
jgi:hypothetical protein